MKDLLNKLSDKYSNKIKIDKCYRILAIIDSIMNDSEFDKKDGILSFQNQRKSLLENNLIIEDGKIVRIDNCVKISQEIIDLLILNNIKFQNETTGNKNL
jgi:hypothetical protein